MVLSLSEDIASLQEAIQEKEAVYAGTLKLGRTQLQDAVPVSFGQVCSAWAQAVARDRWRLYKVEERLRQVSLGGIDNHARPDGQNFHGFENRR